MGTALQQFGHDIVLLHFIDRVLKRRGKELFYIVSPAMGPKIDVHFWNQHKNEYTSAYNVSHNNFIPEFSLRLNFNDDIMRRLEQESNYRSLEWYKVLCSKLKRDLKEYVMEICSSIEKNIADLPDVIGIDETGQENLWAELKFEGFGKNAKESVLKQFTLASKQSIPFHLVIPKKAVYNREITDRWIRSNLPKEMTVYKFSLATDIVTPKKSEVEFIEVTKG